MFQIKKFLIILLITSFTTPLASKEPTTLITEIVNEAAMILSSNDPVESKIIRLKQDVNKPDFGRD